MCGAVFFLLLVALLGNVSKKLQISILRTSNFDFWLQGGAIEENGTCHGQNMKQLVHLLGDKQIEKVGSFLNISSAFKQIIKKNTETLNCLFREFFKVHFFYFLQILKGSNHFSRHIGTFKNVTKTFFDYRQGNFLL
jgi:hypothetical protein